MLKRFLSAAAVFYALLSLSPANAQSLQPTFNCTAEALNAVLAGLPDNVTGAVSPGAVRNVACSAWYETLQLVPASTVNSTALITIFQNGQPFQATLAQALQSPILPSALTVGPTATVTVTINGQQFSGTVAQIVANAAGAAGLGTVTSVAMTVPSILSVAGSPITGAGTLAVSLASESANTVFAGPTSGGATTPAFRALVLGDMPSGVLKASNNLTDVSSAATALSNLGGLPLAGGTLTGKLVTSASAAGGAGFNLPHGAAPSSPTNGDCWTTTTGLFCRINGTTVGPFSSGGSVTSVALSAPASLFTVSGSPVTTTGTLALALATQSANCVVAGPTSGGAAAPTCRALVAADIPAGVIGAVTSVALSMPGIFTVTGSPVTTSGTLTATLANESANTVWAGPTSGSPTSPTFRALVNADMPAAVALTSAANAFTATQSNGVVTLTSAATITPTFGTSSGNVFLLTLAGNVTTLKFPAGNVSGSCGILEIQQPNAGGPFTISAWGAGWKFPGGTTPVLSTAANAIDAISFCGISNTVILASPVLTSFQ